jgi:hypothetical protein
MLLMPEKTTADKQGERIAKVMARAGLASKPGSPPGGSPSTAR